MRFRIVAWGAAAALGVGLAVPASAGSGNCTRSATNGGRACVYVNDDYVGMFAYKWQGGDLSNVSGPNNDVMSSWENNSGRNGAWYKDANGQGECNNMLAWKSSPDVGWVDNDDMSSWRMNDSC